MRFFSTSLFAVTFSLTLPGLADTPEDERNLMTAAKYWAGINCGNMIPMEEAYQAQLDLNALGQERASSYRRRIKVMIDKASNREVACQSIKEALEP